MSETDRQRPVIWVVDDDAALRRALADLLRSAGYQVQTWGDAEGFMREADTARPACLLVDLRLPGRSGVELQSWLIEQGVANPVVFLTGYPTTRIAVETMKAGAFDFLEKPVDAATLVDTIERAAAFAIELWGAEARRTDCVERLESLTPRERQVLDLVVKGHLNKVIADRLGISTKTVEVHRARVMEKMQAGSLAELVQIALLCRLPVLDDTLLPLPHPGMGE